MRANLWSILSLYSRPVAARIPDDITQLLTACAAGDPGAWRQLTPYLYAELGRLAESYLRNERSGHTLQPTALVHESYIRLMEQRLPRFESRGHFLALAAQVMRQVLVDSARAHRAAKRGGGVPAVPIEEAEPVIEGFNWSIIELDEALNRLRARNEAHAQVVEFHYFGGLHLAEIASVTGRSERTLARELRAAKLFLARELGGAA